MRSEIVVFLIALASLILNAIVGYSKKKNISFWDWKGRANSLNWIVVSITMSATVVGGGMFLGIGQMGYEAGTVGIFIGLIYLIGFILLGFFSNKIRTALSENSADNLIDLISKVYGEKVVVVFCVGNLLMYTALLGAQFAALWEFKDFMEHNHSFDMLLWINLGLAFLSVFIYPVFGGFKKDVHTDIANMCWLFLSGVIILSQIFSEKIDFSTLRPEQISGTAYGPVFIIGALLFITPSFLMRFDIWQRVVTAKSDAASRKGFILSGIVSFLFFSMFTLIGIWAFTNGAGNSKYATLEILSSRFANNPIVFGVIIGSFFSALLNCADTYINNTGLFLSKLTHKSLWEKQNDEAYSSKLLARVRVNCFIVIAISIGFTVLFKDFINLLAGAFSVILVFIPTMLGIFEKKWRSRSGAFYSSVVSLFVFIVLFSTQLIDRKSAFAPCVVLACLIYYSFLLYENRSDKRQVVV